MKDLLDRDGNSRELLNSGTTYNQYQYAGVRHVPSFTGIKPAIYTRHYFMQNNFQDTTVTDHYFAKGLGITYQVVGQLYHSQIRSGIITVLDSIPL
ncbi:MAG: hypothetical protein GC180_02250 [Bacteroidetes bacterium]|nr:hypothetical protein [Bacteroidota bacterium]